MLVRYLVSMSSPFVTREVGDKVDLPDDEAERLIKAGFAEKVKAATKPTAEENSK